MVNLLNGMAKEQLIKGLGTILLGLALVSCGDTDGAPEDLVGTAATGAATSGTVYAIDATGVEISTAINADGYFRFDARGMTAPFILKSVADNGTDPDLYSYAEGTDVTANITPMSNLALFIVNGNADPAPLYDSWTSTFGNITVAALTDVQAMINANLSMQYTAFGFDPLVFDFIGVGFSANSTGFDGLLDAMTVDPVAGSILFAGFTTPLTLNPAIDITGYDIGGDSVAVSGAYSMAVEMVVDTVSLGSSQLAINLPASSVPTKTDSQIVEDMFITFYGATGTIVINTPPVVTVEIDAATLIETTIAVLDATITTPDPDSAVINYVATYTYVQNP